MSDLDTVVRLAGDRRKLLRHINVADLHEMDTLRSPDDRRWRGIYAQALPVVTQYGTFGAAVESGAFTESTE